MIDDGVRQIAGRLRRQQHRAAVSADRAALFDQRVQRRFFDFDLHRAAQIQPHTAAGAHQHGAVIGRDRAHVLDARRDQRDEAAVSCQRTAIDDSGCAVALEHEAAVREILIADPQRRSDQTADIDHRRFTEQHTVRIDQEHAAVGRERTLNRRHVGAEHTVQRNRGFRGLQELNARVFADRELFPVDRQAIAVLGNGHRILRRVYAAAADRHLTAGRQVHRQNRRSCQQQTARQQYSRRRRRDRLLLAITRLATSAADLTNHLPRCTCRVPNDAINVVQELSPLPARVERFVVRAAARRPPRARSGTFLRHGAPWRSSQSAAKVTLWTPRRLTSA